MNLGFYVQTHNAIFWMVSQHHGGHIGGQSYEFQTGLDFDFQNGTQFLFN